ncbi:esterase [Alicyclobacillus contaminans]|uniref:Esterase n=2 Tax=Tetragenococcus osmophilus TaxID=526944 RepID=A0AA37XLS8_9ENTE|nr:hotdog fold thioesterase [Tetragenococcus osmophilus]GMA52847.1 esterase [Alicyclobacillus contaminans]GMA73157.1 esterase [Tetragenococcus osmophilus]
MENTLMDALGMEIVSAEKESVVMTMPVDHRTRQPAQYLHGGASAALAETAASIGASANIDSNKETIFGIEINANHIKSKTDGTVTAKATPLHIGRKTMVWRINITDEKDQLICAARCTLGVVAK